MHGFDISHYQGYINFDALATDPHAGYLYMKASEGATNKDNMYSTYYREARRVGFKVGSYHFFRGNYSAREQFENFRSVLRNYTQDLIPIIDVEVLARRVSIYQYMDDAECQQIISHLYNTESVGCDTLLNTQTPNIILILLEGCGGEFMEIGGKTDVMPNLNLLTREGVYFTNCYGNTWRTDRGTVCAWSGYPSFPTMSVMKMFLLF